MGMGYAPSVVDVISEDGLKAICPIEYQAFMDKLSHYKVSLEDHARDRLEDALFEVLDPTLERVSDQVLDQRVFDAAKDIRAAFALLQDAFRKATTVENECLELWDNHHDSQNEGDRYDDVDGVFWEIGNAWVKSKPHERFQQYISRAGFVNLG